MAPMPINSQPEQPRPTTSPSSRGLSTGSIVGIVIFSVFAFSMVASVAAFYIHKRAERMRLPPEERSLSYHPFRTESFEARLLDGEADTVQDEKASMFSRSRGSSLSLYAHCDMQDVRKSMDSMSLIPLHVTPAEESHDPFERPNTRTSRALSETSTFSRATRDTLSPLSLLTANEVSNMEIRTTRPRSTSASSSRYYESIPEGPTIPKIVHTLSD